MLNEVRVIGNLGRDPEGFDTKNGKGCKLSVATSRKYKAKDASEYTEETEWHRIVVFGQPAEFCLNYLSKGRLVCICGRLKTSKYLKDGVDHYSTDIVADPYGGVIALGKGDGGGNSDAADVDTHDDAEDVPF